MGGGDLRQFAQRFQLDDYFTLDKKVQLLALDDMAFVTDVHFHLALKRDAAEFHFDAKRLLLNGFQQSRPQIAVDFNRRADNRLGQLIAHGFSLCVLCVLCG